MKLKNLPLIVVIMFVCFVSVSLTYQQAIAIGCVGTSQVPCGDCETEYCDPDGNHYDCTGNSQATQCICTSQGNWMSCTEIEGESPWCTQYVYYDAACENVIDSETIGATWCSTTS